MGRECMYVFFFFVVALGYLVASGESRCFGWILRTCDSFHIEEAWVRINFSFRCGRGMVVYEGGMILLAAVLEGGFVACVVVFQAGMLCVGQQSVD